MSIAGGVDRAVDRGASIGCDAIQVFLKNNLQWRGKPFTEAEVERFGARRAETGIEPAFAHTSYLINLAATDAGVRGRSIAALVDEIRRATRLGLPFLVMHPGAHMGAGVDAGLHAVARSLDEAFETTSDSPVRIALETTAGQGTSLGSRFEHLARILELVARPQRVVVCVDTCHVFVAGYDIRTASGYERTMDELDRIIGCGRIAAFHLNDSKAPLGSRVDRHEHIGKGHLGLEAFRCVLRDPRLADVPMVLETPKGEDLREDVENLRILRELAG